MRQLPRTASVWASIERAAQDVHYAGRLLRRRPALSATAILTLMLAMGGTTAVFGLMDALLLRDLPVERPGELVRLAERRSDGTSTEAFTLATEDMLQRDSRTLSGVIASSLVAGRPSEIEADGARRSAFVQLVSDNSGELMEIVGVVKDSKWINLRDDSPAMYYRPYRQMGGTPVVRLVIRTSGDAEPVSRALPGLAQSIDRGIALTNVLPFREIVNRTLVIERLIAQVSAWFSGLALVIAAVGLYGMLAFGVARRRREIGLRIAVGASRGTIERMFLKESFALVAVGIALGIPLATAVARLASSMLFGLTPHDPASIGIACAAVTLVTIAAAYLPARSASRTDPLIALRDE